jgi:hypothetical protein
MGHALQLYISYGHNEISPKAQFLPIDKIFSKE